MAVGGTWTTSEAHEDVLDPLNGDVILRTSLPTEPEARRFAQSLASCPKSGLHNPFRNVTR